MLPARRPYPDELVSSAVARCSRQFNIPIKRLGRVYLGRDSWSPSFLGASPLIEFAGLFRMAPEDLLWKHTAFPYSTAMMLPEYYERALANIFGEALDARGFGAVTQNVSSGLHFKRFCKECAREERIRHLESYWHRSHNLPGVWVCADHECPLWSSSISVGKSGLTDKAMPHECIGRRLANATPSASLLSIARLSQHWLNRARTPGSAVGAEEYRQRAIRNNWLSEGRPVAVERLTGSLTAIFSKRFLVDCGLPEGPQHWALLMMQPGVDVPFIPVKHAVLQTLLSQPRPSHLPRLDHKSTGPPASRSEQLDAFYADAAKRHLRSAIASGRHLTTEQFLRAIGCWGTYRHRKAELPKLKAIVREFRGSPATVKRLRPGKTLYRIAVASQTTT